jgi:hypothetical protein
MSLQTSALEYAINHFDTIWTKFIKAAKEVKDFYSAATLTWKNNTFNLTTDEDNEIVYEYNNRTTVILFTLSYQYNILDTNKDEHTIKVETLNSLKNQLKTLQQAEQEIAESVEQVVVTYHHNGNTYTADTLVNAPWFIVNETDKEYLKTIDDEIAYLTYDKAIKPTTKTVSITKTTNKEPIRFDKYNFKFTEDAYIINHYQNLWPEDQLTVIQFLENMAELKACYPYNINYGNNTDDSVYDLYYRQGRIIIDAVVKNLTNAPNSLDSSDAQAQMAYINDAFQDAKDANASEPLQDLFDSLNDLIANMTINQIDNQNAIDELARDFIKKLTEEAHENYKPFS